MDLHEYIQTRLIKIQSKNNFNPAKGLEQVQNNPKLLNFFGRFQELLELIKALNLDLKIPYDPLGLNPETLNEVIPKKEFVYFFQFGTSPIWKIGYSQNPPDRQAAGQTWVEKDLQNRYQIPGGRSLEKQIHRYLRKFKSRSQNKSGGEVFELSAILVKNLVNKLQNSDQTFLREKFDASLQES